MYDLSKEEVDLINQFCAHRESALLHYITVARAYKDKDTFNKLCEDKKIVLGLINKIHMHRKETI